MTTIVALLLVVRIFDQSGETLADRMAAVRTADTILRQADVTPRWIDCSLDASSHASACTVPLVPGEIMMRITAAPALQGPADAAPLGYSLVEPRTGGGILGTVFSDRVEWLAGAAHTQPQTLMGRAIAHEIGHLLLGTNTHSRQGLMRAVWTAAELTKDRPADWLFTVADTARLHHSRLGDAGTLVAAGGGSDPGPDPDGVLIVTLDDPS